MLRLVIIVLVIVVAVLRGRHVVRAKRVDPVGDDCKRPAN